MSYSQPSFWKLSHWCTRLVDTIDVMVEREAVLLILHSTSLTVLVSVVPEVGGLCDP